MSKNIKIGLLIANYNCGEYLQKCLEPWFQYKEKYNLKISVVDGRFKNFGGPTQNSNDGGLELLEKFHNEGKIDFLNKPNRDLEEFEARNIALKPLLESECNYICSWGTDELAKLEELESIFDYVNKKQDIAVFHINYKNLVFDNKSYTDGFCPRRIWKVESGGFRLKGFNYDDDCVYELAPTRALYQDVNMPTIKIPKNVAFIRHETWLSNERSKLKVEYQQKHFGPPKGAGCSFKWNYIDNKLEWNLDYFHNTKQLIPEIFVDE
jgi:hypothetical protein